MPPPYGGQGPREGSLYLPDAEVLAAIVRDWTATPEDCWFCVWDGFGALASLDSTGGQCPDIWWPADRAWCVASEVDLQWYVGGPGGLIDAIPADDRIEALPAAPDDPVSRVLRTG